MMVKIMIMDLVVEMMVNGWRRRFQVVKGFAEYYVAKSKEVLQRIAKSFCAGPSSEMIVIDLGNRSRYFHQSHSCLPRWSLKTCRVLPPQDAINICWQNNTESISKVILPRTQQQIQLPPLLWKAPRSLEALASTVSLLFSGGRHQPSSLYSDIIFHVDRQVKNLCQSCGQYR